MNLSGKKTRTGRNSGECCIVQQPPKGKAYLLDMDYHMRIVWCNFQVQGQRISKGDSSVLFLCLKTDELLKVKMKLKIRGTIMMTNELKRTPLFDEYAKYGGKTIDFGGWELPVQFSSIKEEHDAVRNRAGLFDVSHMGEIFVEGPDALEFLQNLLSNDISKIAIGGAQYNAMCYENGGVVDDLLTYKLADNHYLLCVNAANIEKDFDWMIQQHQR